MESHASGFLSAEACLHACQQLVESSTSLKNTRMRIELRDEVRGKLFSPWTLSAVTLQLCRSIWYGGAPIDFLWFQLKYCLTNLWIHLRPANAASKICYHTHQVPSHDNYHLRRCTVLSQSFAWLPNTGEVGGWPSCLYNRTKRREKSRFDSD